MASPVDYTGLNPGYHHAENRYFDCTNGDDPSLKIPLPCISERCFVNVSVSLLFKIQTAICLVFVIAALFCILNYQNVFSGNADKGQRLIRNIFIISGSLSLPGCVAVCAVAMHEWNKRRTDNARVEHLIQ